MTGSPQKNLELHSRLRDATVAAHFRYWWLDELFTSVFGLLMLGLGLSQLIEDTRAGVRWWSLDFWSRPLPPAEEQPTTAPLVAGEGGAKGEATPLVPPVKH